LVNIEGITSGGQGEGGESGGLDGCEGWDPIGLIFGLGEGDGEGVSHRDSEGLAVEGIATARGEEDGDPGATEGGDGAEDGSEVVVVGEVFEDDEGAGGLEEVCEWRVWDSMAGGEESSVDGVSGDLVEDGAGGGVDRDGLRNGCEEVGVGFDFGFGDEDRVERVGGGDVVFEDEGTF
tara:strand:- start:4048 stop:4581 length:534 start_codon:yes stop_codon:yes gene_type:complete